MKKWKSNFWLLLFLIPLFSSNFCTIPANGLKSSCHNFSKISQKHSEELALSNTLKDLALKGFETERLKIDKLKEEDYDILAKYLMDQEVTKYLVVEKTLRFYNVKDAKRYVEILDKIAHTATFTLRLKDNKKPIGILGFSFIDMPKDRVVNISYWVGKEYQNKGYAKEAIPLIVNEAFNNIGNFKFYIDFRTQNISSKKLAEAIIDYIAKNNPESSKLVVNKFNCFRLDTEEYLIFKETKDINPEKVAA